MEWPCRPRDVGPSRPLDPRAYRLELHTASLTERPQQLVGRITEQYFSDKLSVDELRLLRGNGGLHGLRTRGFVDVAGDQAEQLAGGREFAPPAGDEVLQAPDQGIGSRIVAQVDDVRTSARVL